MTAPPVVAVVRALYPFTGGEAGDLTFREDEVIRVTQKVDFDSKIIVIGCKWLVARFYR